MPAGGPEGNERLTSTVGLVLVVLLVVEAATTLSLSSFLPVHIFLGLLLLPPIVLKLASTGWRFVRYYTGSKPYRLKGPPELVLRLLAPALVASTVVLFGTGVAFLIVGHGGGLLLTAHVVSFVIWGVLMTVHVLAYLRHVLRHGVADWRPAARSLAGAKLRRYVVAGALAAGVVVGLGTYSAQTAWLSSRRHHHHEHGSGDAAPLRQSQFAHTEWQARGGKSMTPDQDQLLDFARRYAVAWCSQDPSSVAEHYAPRGSLAINGGPPAVGRAAITEAARGFMIALPDLQVFMDDLLVSDNGIEFHWTFTGTNTGPGGTGNRVRITGFEEWTIGDDGLIAESQGQYDQAEYDRQLEHGVEEPRS